MNAERRTVAIAAPAAWVVCATALLLGAGSAVSADSARARFEQERARCLSGQSHQDRATCLREANAAYAEARRGRLDNRQQAMHERNAMARCERLPAAERTDCEHRMRGHGTVSGSVEGGGLYRETVTVEIGQPGAAAAGGAQGSGTSAAPVQPGGTGSTPVAPANTTGNSPGTATAPMPPAQPPVQPAQ